MLMGEKETPIEQTHRDTRQVRKMFDQLTNRSYDQRYSCSQQDQSPVVWHIFLILETRLTKEVLPESVP